MVNTVREQEVWKHYPDYDFIEVSNLGRIRTKDRVVTRSNGVKYHAKGRILKQQLQKNGYVYVSFSVNDKTVNLRVNRMVAITFIPNPDNLPEVNHIDNDPINNAVSNLEWCTRKYNNDYKNNFGTSPTQIQGRPIIAVNLDSFEALWFKSQSEASRQLGILKQSINAVVKGKQNVAGSYWFCYADENAIEKARAKFGDKVAKKVEELMREN